MLAANAFAMHPNVRTHRTRHLRRHLRRVAWKPLFRGSHDMLVRQNEEIDRLELPRIEDNDELAELEESRELVPVKPARSLEVAENLAPTRRYCRPWTREFLEDLSAAYYEKFHRPIRVNSLVRTVEQQRKLRRHNRNAAPVEGDTASTHLTGMTVDIAKRGMTRAQHRWMEQYLLPLQQQGLIEPVEERRQAVFHVMVYNSYSDWRKSKKTPPDAASKTVSN
jgi:hypothetical protein